MDGDRISGLTGRVHSVESFATKDGAGIRCAVFLSGCPLRCKCCHNPDTWSGGGEEYSAKRLVSKILRFKPYFKRGGGVTFTGGEPLLQAKFLTAVSKLLKSEGVHVALDTSACVWNEDVSELLNYADLAIVDLKRSAEEEYRSFAGGSLTQVLEFLKETDRRNIPLWLRTVMIPGDNDNVEELVRLAAIAKRFRFERYELLAFHTMGFSKYAELGILNPLAGVPALEPGRLDRLQAELDTLLKKAVDNHSDLPYNSII